MRTQYYRRLCLWSVNGFPVINGWIDVNNDGLITLADNGILVQIGQTFSVTVHNATFGTIGQGFDANRDGLWDYDFWHQPVGESDWPSGSFRLVDIQSIGVNVITGLPCPSVTVAPNTICTGGTAILTANVTGGSGLIYQWQQFTTGSGNRVPTAQLGQTFSAQQATVLRPQI